MKKIISLGLVLSPSLALAVFVDTTAFTLLGKLTYFLNLLVPVLITIAVIYFIYGVIKFIASGGDEEAKKLGRATIINGLIGLFVIVAFWGIIGIVQNTLGVGNEARYNIIPITGTN